jgi:hypothetical protein
VKILINELKPSTIVENKKPSYNGLFEYGYSEFFETFFLFDIVPYFFINNLFKYQLDKQPYFQELWIYLEMMKYIIFS